MDISLPNRSHYTLELSKKGQSTLKYKDKYLHSKYDPIKEGMKLASSLPFKGKKYVIISGLALGYHITPLLDGDQKINVLVLESSVEVVNYLEKTFRLSLLREAKLFFGDLSYLNNWLFQHIEEDQSDSILFFDHKPSIEIDPDYYKKAKIIVNNVLKYKLQSYLTTLGFAQRWHENSLKNLKAYSRFSMLSQKSDLPIFLVGSGPSLDDQIKHLSKLANVGIIIAFAPAYHRLVEEGVSVHFLISIDGGIANRIHLSQYRLRDESTVLISTLSVTPHLFHLWKGDILLLNLELPIEEYLLDDIPGIPMQGNVALAAYWMAQKMTSGDIYLIGMDFAFTNGAYHFKGNQLEDTLAFSGNRLRPYDRRFYDIISRFKKTTIPGQDGKEIQTNLAMQSYLSWMEEAISQSRQATYTLNPLGARIKGAEYRSLDSLLQTLPTMEEGYNPKTMIKPLSKGAFRELKNKLNDLLGCYSWIGGIINGDVMAETGYLEDLINEIDDIKTRDIIKLSLIRMIRKSRLKALSSDDYKEITISLQRTQRLIQSILAINND